MEGSVKTKLYSVALLAAPLFGFAAITATHQFEPSSSLWIEGTSTVRSFKCVAKKLDAEIVAERTAVIAAFVSQATVRIPVAGLDCANGTMNGHMRKALKLEANPEIEFALASYVVNEQSATLQGDLTIAGEKRTVELPATVTDDTESGMVRVKASKQINMKDWGVKPPSLMLGAMKVKELVTVSFDVSIKR